MEGIDDSGLHSKGSSGMNRILETGWTELVGKRECGIEGIKDDPRVWGLSEWVNGALFWDAKVGRGLGFRWGGAGGKQRLCFDGQVYIPRWSGQLGTWVLNSLERSGLKLPRTDLRIESGSPDSMSLQHCLPWTKKILRTLHRELFLQVDSTMIKYNLPNVNKLLTSVLTAVAWHAENASGVHSECLHSRWQAAVGTNLKRFLHIILEMPYLSVGSSNNKPKQC